ncbi:unnamed protein product [Phaedon cochleariae]|uniref:KANL2-like probable zinc-finger domain-containing protein n=1 Tax=Phaedon cochleariae TaxID=80249 RepID=A0A9N9SER5_PHACE|nr:unnamed protein product [Phaedon cochleariae]
MKNSTEDEVISAAAIYDSYLEEDYVTKCLRPALPCTKHCTLHIMLNPEQMLFEYCTAKFADNTQCATPVFDISHEIPLCAEHARKRVKSPELEVEDMQMVEQVLSLNENGLEQALVTQAHLLEETDINTVLSTIQVDEFSDFFTVNRNGEYEPSREEAEELEKALAEVDNDVKSLEKLSQTQGLLDSLLDETNLAETLVQGSKRTAAEGLILAVDPSFVKRQIATVLLTPYRRRISHETLICGFLVQLLRG